MVYILINFLPRAMMILTLFSFRASASLLMASTSSVNVILPSIKIKFTKLFISIRCSIKWGRGWLIYQQLQVIIMIPIVLVYLLLG